ncbi:MAG: GMP/IMP nucleotidase [Magnetococcales bacterium]|nr:GMP/IMP nucleotidase [Magnetococcales bacterium]
MVQTPTSTPSPVPLSWPEIDTVLLDMDGTLLDLAFDDRFFREIVPAAYGRRHGLAFEEARHRVFAAYKTVERTLPWYDIDYWSETLEIDVAALKTDHADGIRLLPHTLTFLKALQVSGRTLFLVTNAHPSSLSLKMAQTGIAPYFRAILSSHQLGLPKEEITFWARLAEKLHLDLNTCLLIEDAEAVLRSARRAGMPHLLHCAAPSSTLPTRYSAEFPSVARLTELLPIPGIEIARNMI